MLGVNEIIETGEGARSARHNPWSPRFSSSSPFALLREEWDEGWSERSWFIRLTFPPANQPPIVSIWRPWGSPPSKIISNAIVPLSGHCFPRTLDKCSQLCLRNFAKFEGSCNEAFTSIFLCRSALFFMVRKHELSFDRIVTVRVSFGRSQSDLSERNLNSRLRPLKSSCSN